MRRHAIAGLMLLLVHCSPADADALPDGGEGPPADMATPVDAEGDLAPAPPQPARTFLLTLDNGAFPPAADHPSALVYLPNGFSPTPPVSLIVYIHGFQNCVQNVVRQQADAIACTPGGQVRNAHELISQLEATGKKAMLLVPEVAFDQSSANPGKLGETNGFRNLLIEALQKLNDPLQGLTVAGIGKVALASHSGGYQAAAGIAARGGVAVNELYLFDSLYGNSPDFEAWIKQDLPGLAGGAPAHRFADVYTDTGGTLSNSQALAGTVSGFLLDKAVMVDDRTTATWPLDTYHHGVLFKRSMLAHDAVPRYYFQTLVATSGL